MEIVSENGCDTNRSMHEEISVDKIVPVSGIYFTRRVKDDSFTIFYFSSKSDDEEHQYIAISAYDVIIKGVTFMRDKGLPSNEGR